VLCVLKLKPKSAERKLFPHISTCLRKNPQCISSIKTFLLDWKKKKEMRKMKTFNRKGQEAEIRNDFRNHRMYIYFFLIFSKYN